jgi:hypothetical protein
MLNLPLTSKQNSEVPTLISSKRQKSGDDTTDIEALYFQTVFDICISDNFLDKDQSFQDTLCHKHYNIFSHSEKNSLRNIANPIQK